MKRDFEEIDSVGVVAPTSIIIPLTVRVDEIKYTPIRGQRICTTIASLLQESKLMVSKSHQVPVIYLDAKILPASVTIVEEITDVIVTRAPTAGPSEPFRCTGCVELSAQIEAQNVRIESQTARIESQTARIETLSAYIESQKISKQIEKMRICLVDVEEFFGSLMSTTTRMILGSIRGDCNGDAHYIRTYDHPTLKQFKLNLVKTHVNECASNKTLYNKIVKTYGKEQIKELFDFVLSLDSNQFDGGVGSSSSADSGALNESEQDIAREWWTD